MRARINQRLVVEVEIPPRGKRIKIYDTAVTGFGLTVLPTGRKTFFVEYGPKGARRRMTLGPFGVLTVEQARDMARSRLGQVIDGSDPMVEREQRRAMPTFGEWADSYLEEVKRRKKHPRADVRYLDRARKRWGPRPLDSITVEDIRAGMADQSGGHPIRGNRWLASVRACFGAAWRANLIDDNPALRVRLNRENPPRARVLSDEELARVVKAIDEVSDPHARTALRLLLATGARRSEALRAAWTDVDLDAGMWRIPSPKAGRPQVIPLHPDAVAMLRESPRLGPWVIPGRNPAKPRTNIHRAWKSVQERAEVPDVHIHDLRRTFGLHVARSAGLHVASKLFRHSTIKVTEEVYAPLGIEDLRDGLEKMKRARAKVIPIRRT